MASRTYIAVVEESPEGGYGVSFPDLPGCVSAGDDLDEACTNAVEALSIHLDGMLEDGDDFPEARTMGQIDKDLGRPAGRFIYSAITADVEDDSERVNVYLPKSLLSQIQRFGERTGIDNRSTFMRLAARYYLSRESESQTLKVKAAGSRPA
jgi:predicted RNase H-like HicB family nuclease